MDKYGGRNLRGDHEGHRSMPLRGPLLQEEREASSPKRPGPGASSTDQGDERWTSSRQGEMRPHRRERRDDSRGGALRPLQVREIEEQASM